MYGLPLRRFADGIAVLVADIENLHLIRRLSGFMPFERIITVCAPDVKCRRFSFSPHRLDTAVFDML